MLFAFIRGHWRFFIASMASSMVNRATVSTDVSVPAAPDVPSKRVGRSWTNGESGLSRMARARSLGWV